MYLRTENYCDTHPEAAITTCTSPVEHKYYQPPGTVATVTYGYELSQNIDMLSIY